jgi:hypothetical protein
MHSSTSIVMMIMIGVFAALSAPFMAIASAVAAAFFWIVAWIERENARRVNHPNKFRLPDIRL